MEDSSSSEFTRKKATNGKSCFIRIITHCVVNHEAPSGFRDSEDDTRNGMIRATERLITGEARAKMKSTKGE